MKRIKFSLSLNTVFGILIFFSCLYCAKVAYATTFTYTYDKTTPAGTDAPSVIDDRIREVKLAVAERMNVDHYWPYASAADAAGGNEVASQYTGEQRKITFYGNITDPTQVTGKSHLYQKGGEFYFQDATNTTLKLTSAGTINIVSADLVGTLANATYFSAVDFAGTGTVDLIKADANDVAVVPDNSQTATNAAPTSSTGIANKKYVDDQDAADHPTYSGGESHTDGSGLIIKMNHSATPSGNISVGNVAITFGTPFPTAIKSVVVTLRNDTNPNIWYSVDSVSTSGFTFYYKEYEGTHAADGFDWIAIGY